MQKFITIINQDVWVIVREADEEEMRYQIL